MSEIKEVKLNQTSRYTSDVNDVILTTPNNQNLKTRQILRSRIINNAKVPSDSLSIDLIHERKNADGTWSTNYEDLRKLKEGESVRIQLDSSQTQSLYKNLTDHYEISKSGVGNGKRFVVSGVKDIENIIFADTSNKKALAEKVISEITDQEAGEIISKSKKLIKEFFTSLPQIRLEILESLKKQLEEKLAGSEKEVQKWIDENRQVRCLIFGLEYIDYKREVSFGNSRFDLLTEQSGTHHVIIEMKSPNVDLFETVSKKTTNGQKDEYIISSDLAEAIPQIIQYFEEYNRETEVTFKKNGVQKKSIAKGIIIIGRNKKDDPIWQSHYNGLCHRLSGVEILTYDHLVEKMSNQIENLKSLSDTKKI